jgi:hypothetical protein
MQQKFTDQHGVAHVEQFSPHQAIHIPKHQNPMTLELSHNKYNKQLKITQQRANHIKVSMHLPRTRYNENDVSSTHSRTDQHQHLNKQVPSQNIASRTIK